MIGGLRISLAMVMALAISASARADWYAIPHEATPSSFSLATGRTLGVEVDVHSGRLASAEDGSLGASLALGAGVFGFDGVPGGASFLVDPTRPVVSMPDAPSSAALFLSAMVSVGAWHLVRSTRHLHLGELPAWYHPNAPAQIGHAVPFDMHLMPLPPCRFEEPSAPHQLLCRAVRIDRARRQAAISLSTATPRAPPALVA